MVCWLSDPLASLQVPVINWSFWCFFTLSRERKLYQNVCEKYFLRVFLLLCNFVQILWNIVLYTIFDFYSIAVSMTWYITVFRTDYRVLKYQLFLMFEEDCQNGCGWHCIWAGKWCIHKISVKSISPFGKFPIEVWQKNKTKREANSSEYSEDIVLKMSFYRTCILMIDL